MVYVATSDGSFAVEPDYYQKALHWDDARSAAAENAGLGWTVELDGRRQASAAGDRTSPAA